MPAPPSTVSLPRLTHAPFTYWAKKLKLSSPASPNMRSLPVPPSMASLPPPPRISSLPLPPPIVSHCAPPSSVSSPAPPLNVTPWFGPPWRSGITASEAISRSLKSPPVAFSMFAKLTLPLPPVPPPVAVPVRKSTVTPLRAPVKSSVSLSPPPSTESLP